MHARTRALLPVAVTLALASPLALADKKVEPPKGNPTAEAASSTPRPSLPNTAVEKAGDALDHNPEFDPADTRDVGKDAAPPDTPPGAADDGVKDAAEVASTSASGNAQTNPGKGNWWTDADGDSDGRLSRAESGANAGLSSRFASIDANADGFVTRDEYQDFYTANAAQGAGHAADHSAVVTRAVWTRFDADADGKLTAREVDADARLKADFGAADSDDDGFVSEDEYRAFYRPH